MADLTPGLNETMSDETTPPATTPRMMPVPAQTGAGRKRVQIDLNEVERLASLDLTQEMSQRVWG
jgi:hypothetical protein